jgi:hypothetical protein
MKSSLRISLDFVLAQQRSISRVKNGQGIAIKQSPAN